MTIKETIRRLKAKLECMTRDISGLDDDCNLGRCDDCKLNYEQGNMGEQKECLRMAIKALEQTNVLGKIRAEIQSNRDDWIEGLDSEWHAYNRCLEIFDKYKAESEE